MRIPLETISPGILHSILHTGNTSYAAVAEFHLKFFENSRRVSSDVPQRPLRSQQCPHSLRAVSDPPYSRKTLSASGWSSFVVFCVFWYLISYIFINYRALYDYCILTIIVLA
jgi:hypothetical protein